MLEGGTRTSSKNSSAVSCAFWPIFLRLRPRLKPGRSVSTSTSVTPLAPADVSVLAATMTRSASPPLVMKVFCPLTTSSLPWRSAVVRIACRSLPVPGSVMAMAVITSPLAIRGSHVRFCSSLP